MGSIRHDFIAIQLVQIVDTSQSETVKRKQETETDHFNLRTSLAFFTRIIRCKLCTELLLGFSISQLILMLFPFENMSRITSNS